MNFIFLSSYNKIWITLQKKSKHFRIRKCLVLSLPVIFIFMDIYEFYHKQIYLRYNLHIRTNRQNSFVFKSFKNRTHRLYRNILVFKRRNFKIAYQVIKSKTIIVLLLWHLSSCICRENSRKWRRKEEKRGRERCRERNYHKLNAIKWIYILFAYITERADTNSCSPLNDEEMQACYVHGARKRKKEFLRHCLMRSNSNLNIYIYILFLFHYLD